MPGDVLFAAGALALAWFLIGLRTGWSYRRTSAQPAPFGANDGQTSGSPADAE